MFEEYLQDSAHFYQKAIETKANEIESKRYYRASIFFAVSAIEAFVNYVANSFELARNLNREEEYFINDKVVYFNDSKCEFQEKTEYHKLDHKIKYLIKKFHIEFDFTGGEWSEFQQFKKYRDSLVHPRKIEDETECAEYKKEAKRGLTRVITLISILSKGIYRKKLRKKLLDLIPI